MDELATVLGDERHLLDLLLYRLITCRELLAAGGARFLAYAATEVEETTERVQEAELRRSLLVARLARRLDSDELTLMDLCLHSREPFGTIFSEHRKAFVELMSEIEEVVSENRRLTPGPVEDVLVEAGHQALLAAISGLSFPSLTDFLA